MIDDLEQEHEHGDDVALEPPAQRVDLVAAPARYPRTPLLLLLIVAVLPAIGLYALFRWSDERADRYDARVEETDDAPSNQATADETVAAVLQTGVFDYRRVPERVADLADANRLAEALEPVFSFLGPTSCAAVSIDGDPVIGTNAATAVIPASTLKLFTAATALEVLGPDHVFTTSVAAALPVEGVVDGDLYLIGGGDPLLTSDDYPVEDDRAPAFNTTSLDRLADAVAASGITRVRGSVVGDGSRYDDEWSVDTWGEGVAGVEAGPYDALFVNDARVLGRSGRQSDPNEAAAREFVRLLGDRGVRVDGGWGSGVADPAAPVIGEVQSAPLVDVVAEMLLTSDDDTAELLVKELGVVAGEEGTRAAGLNVVDRTLRGWGVPMAEVRFVDGSGLSPENRLTCDALLAVLQRVRSGPIPGLLPVAGTSGTLVAEFVDSPMQGRLRAKTGTLGNPPVEFDPPAAKALAGYVDPPPDAPPNAGTIEFVVLLNTPDVDEEDAYRPLWAAFADRLATYPDGPGGGELGPR